MPHRCHGLEDPAGGTPRPCIFAADGKGGPAEVKRTRDGKSCAFCCPDAFARACGSPAGKGNITKHLKQWRESGSPCYEAVFAFGIPGLVLPDAKQHDLRRRAGEVPTFNASISWLHKKKARLKASPWKTDTRCPGTQSKWPPLRVAMQVRTGRAQSEG